MPVCQLHMNGEKEIFMEVLRKYLPVDNFNDDEATFSSTSTKLYHGNENF